jgi:hypothetical protein
MNENDIRRIVRDAFSDAARWSSEYETGDSVVRVVAGVMSSTADSIQVEEPARTQEQWAEKIRSLIQEARDDGMVLWLNNTCFGCSTKSELRIGSESSEASDDPVVWEER